jgi:large subunit ribosomal protein L4
MKLPLRNLEGKEVGSIQVRDDVFAVPMKDAVVHQVVVAQLANARQGTARTKTRAEVSGGGAKPRPQKYTGRARQGSIRSPQWKGGGTVFGPKPRSYRQRTPKRVKRQALVATLSDKAREDRLLVVENLALETFKTKEMVRVLDALDATRPVLLVADGADPSVLRSARNIPRLKMLPASLLNPLDLLNHRTVVLTLDAVKKAEELWGGRFVRRNGKESAEVAES